MIKKQNSLKITVFHSDIKKLLLGDSELSGMVGSSECGMMTMVYQMISQSRVQMKSTVLCTTKILVANRQTSGHC